jgi:hypothetical protein
MSSDRSDRQASKAGALTRLRDLCRLAEELVRLVPHVLPVIDEEPATPEKVAFPTDSTRRTRVDDLLKRLALPWAEWERLFRALPERAAEVELLARVLDCLRDRFEEEEEQHQAKMGACFQDYNAQRARGVKSARLRLPAPPERRIYPKELSCIRSCLASVVEELDRKAAGSTLAALNSALRELAAKIRREHPRQRKVPKFLELIAEQDEVGFDEIADKVHGAPVDDDAVEKTVLAARKAIVEAHLPLAIHVSGRRVLKKYLPAEQSRDFR